MREAKGMLDNNSLHASWRVGSCSALPGLRNPQLSLTFYRELRKEPHGCVAGTEVEGAGRGRRISEWKLLSDSACPLGW